MKVRMSVARCDCVGGLCPPPFQTLDTNRTDDFSSYSEGESLGGSNGYFSDAVAPTAVGGECRATGDDLIPPVAYRWFTINSTATFSLDLPNAETSIHGIFMFRADGFGFGDGFIGFNPKGDGDINFVYKDEFDVAQAGFFTPTNAIVDGDEFKLVIDNVRDVAEHSAFPTLVEATVDFEFFHNDVSEKSGSSYIVHICESSYGARGGDIDGVFSDNWDFSST